jgi:uncharacterized protein (TIGR02117 family)
VRAFLPALAFALAGCAGAPPALPPGPAVEQLAVARRSWHTDLCMAAPVAPDRLAALAADFPGARYLCFGFGDRQYLLSGQHGPLTMLGALLPSEAALLMTALGADPAAAFGAGNVVRLGLTAAGEVRLRAFLLQSLQTDTAGQPMRLGDGPYPGSVYYAASSPYDALATCNTWTADALRAAGLPVGGMVIFAGQVMSRARRIAAAQSQ